MFAQRTLPKKPATRISRTHPGQKKASIRKRLNKSRRTAEFQSRASDGGITVDELRQRLFRQVDAMRGPKVRPARVAAPPASRETSLTGGRITWDPETYGRRSAL